MTLTSLVIRVIQLKVLLIDTHLIVFCMHVLRGFMIYPLHDIKFQNILNNNSKQ